MGQETRGSLSLSSASYTRLREFCSKHGVAAAAIIEELVADITVGRPRTGPPPNPKHDKTAYFCAGCSAVCSWNTDLPAPELAAGGVRTIGSHYCVNCIDAEAEAHHLPRARILAMRLVRGQAVPELAPPRRDLIAEQTRHDVAASVARHANIDAIRYEAERAAEPDIRDEP